jgi:anthranilate/para-aminobenzoate synthase component I
MHQSEFALKDHNFLLETLVEGNLAEHSSSKQHCLENRLINQIKCFKPIRKFFSLSGLNSFLKENPEILEYPEAGIAGYICYEGDMEFILYEEIKKISNVSINSEINTESEIYKQSLKKIPQNHFTVKSFNRNEYIKKIQECQKYIEEGDIYQANISEKISWSEKLSNDDIERLYENLKAENPAPYSALINYSNYAILSSSPESFLKIYPKNHKGKENVGIGVQQQFDDRRVAERTSSRLRRTNDRNVLGVHEDHEDDKNAEIGVRQHAYDWVIESSPIKGTADLSKKNELLISEKEKAEHIMIIDLIRNDLSRISKTGSVKVSEFMEIKKFKNLFHLVSKVSSVLNEDSFLKISSEHRSSKPWMTNKSQNFTSIPDLEKIFSATFPGGSITGTPKIRAMEIIKELEGIKRGPYTGSIGYFKFHEGGEFNIIIRSLVYDKIKQELSFHSGAGITSGSNPEEEFKEIQLKAEKIYQSLGSKAVNY